MKNNILNIALLGTAVCLCSCLDFDDPGSELNAGQTIVDDGTDVLLPECHIDSINYAREITDSAALAAYDIIDEKGYFGYSISAQYCLRGGKNNGVPEAHQYQYNFSLNTDNYAGYFVVTHHDFPYSNADLPYTYSMHEQFNSGARGCYGNVKNILLDLLTQKELNDLPEIKAVNLIYYSLSAQEMADISGPFTYVEDKLKSENPSTYNTMEQIYDSIVKDLDLSVACLKYSKEHRSDEYKALLLDQFSTYPTGTEQVKSNADKFMESCWRLANSIKLRMAMHIVKVAPQKAKLWAEEAVQSGVCESTDMQHALYPAITGFTNPLVEICNSWADNRLCASFESILKSLNHPYVKGMDVSYYDEDLEEDVTEHRDYLWRKNSGYIKNQHYAICTKHKNPILEIPADSLIVGIRAGAKVGEGQSYANNQYIAASTFNSDVMSNAPLYLVKWAEVDFLRAEGALRGWNMLGEAQEFYERGIRNAYLNAPTDFQWYKEFDTPEYDYSKYMKDYMAQEKATDYVQHDPFGDGDDLESRTKIGVKWNGSLDRETLLEMIITQKYIALFPNSWEAWVDLRRTGYPKIFNVMNPGVGDGSLTETNNMIRRMPWAATDPQTKANIEATGLEALGGADLQGTRLWWDVDIPNF